MRELTDVWPKTSPYLVVPRHVAARMPESWQWKLANLIHDLFEHADDGEVAGYIVQPVDKEGRLMAPKEGK